MTNTFGSPLMPVSARVPTGLNRNTSPATSRVGARPFGLRFVKAPARTVIGPQTPAWHLDPAAQVAVANADGSPLHRIPNTGTMRTTGPSPDGGPNTGGEEWSMDFLGDAGE
jgi:putative ATP-grasp target RiPP